VVGVFVNEDPTRIEETAEAACLDLIQLHGDEDPEAVARFGGRAIKVFRRGSLPDPEELAEYEGVWGLLFDVPARPADDDAYGGTGRSWNYEMLAPLPRGRGARQVLVAGGIRPGNARRALERSRADGIDVCSGVESAPGVKDPERMRRLFEEVRHGTP
jgi:phosphoribosylanthranilate isomerase